MIIIIIINTFKISKKKLPSPFYKRSKKKKTKWRSFANMSRARFTIDTFMESHRVGKGLPLRNRNDPHFEKVLSFLTITKCMFFGQAVMTVLSTFSFVDFHTWRCCCCCCGCCVCCLNRISFVRVRSCLLHVYIISRFEKYIINFWQNDSE